MKCDCGCGRTLGDGFYRCSVCSGFYSANGCAVVHNMVTNHKPFELHRCSTELFVAERV
jgi:hypothetical protein